MATTTHKPTALEAQALWEEQLLHTAGMINHLKEVGGHHLYISDDSLDYLESALELSLNLTSAYSIGADHNDTAKAIHDLDSDNYASDGICPGLWKLFPEDEED